MTLQEQLQADLNGLAKAHQNSKKELLKVVMAEISRVSTKEVDDTEVLRILKKMKANAIECNNPLEVTILDEYLPQMMSEETLRQYLEDIVKHNLFAGLMDMGKIMKYLRTDEKANIIDNAVASKIIKEILK